MQALRDSETLIIRILMYAIFAEAALAVLCLLYILFGQAGVIRRSKSTCYPMPAAVEEILRRGSLMQDDDGSIYGLSRNIEGPQGDARLGSYCVRCFVWRPPSIRVLEHAHHCRTCGRCVTKFDHHCGVFGRCIVGGNMPCFQLLVGLFPAAFATSFLAMALGGGPPGSPSWLLEMEQ